MPVWLFAVCSALLQQQPADDLVHVELDGGVQISGDDAMSEAEQDSNLELRGSIEVVVFRAAPAVIFAGLGAIGWALATRASGLPDSRWAISGAGALGGEILGGLAGYGVAALVLGPPDFSQHGDNSWATGYGTWDALFALGLSGLGALGGGITGLAIAEHGSGASAGAYGGALGVMTLGLMATTFGWGLMAGDREAPRVWSLVVLALGSIASASLGVATFAALRR